ncbi:hypothetical protein FBUS_10905 [Fasciolopsis buskii]|uniref:Uncharacterized protein n=1 Tax=Fasciolopsis buskii TaxID=27845 RepID=A0A8E0VGF8_9TREM|nr:hypothetical protein FBUS_10905 [Fasciolopsis buski]
MRQQTFKRNECKDSNSNKKSVATIRHLLYPAQTSTSLLVSPSVSNQSNLKQQQQQQQNISSVQQLPYELYSAPYQPPGLRQTFFPGQQQQSLAQLQGQKHQARQQQQAQHQQSQVCSQSNWTNATSKQIPAAQNLQ